MISQIQTEPKIVQIVYMMNNVQIFRYNTEKITKKILNEVQRYNK